MSPAPTESFDNWQPRPPPAIAGFADHTPAPDVTPVFVILDRHLPHDPSQRRTVVDGLDLTGRARGMLKLPWYRCVCGSWIGSVTFEVRSADGERSQLLYDQLVHADALLPRDDGHHL